MELDYVKLKPIKPAVSGCIRKSLTLLDRSEIPDEKAVHDIRVLMKKSRALLKLTDGHPDNIYYRKNLDELKQVGRMFSLRRETAVQRKIIKELKKENPKIFSSLQESSVNMFFQIIQSNDEKTPADTITSTEQMRVMMERTSYRLRFQPMNTIDPHLLIKRLEQTYNRAADSYLICRNNPKKSSIHKFRMRAKDFLYQLYIFRPLNPVVVKALEKKIDTMTLNLGRYNDLAELINDSGYEYKRESNQPALDELIIRIREKQDMHLNKAFVSAYKIYCPGQKLVNLLGFKLLII
jgi:CHAD domain-containing protein